MESILLMRDMARCSIPLLGRENPLVSVRLQQSYVSGIKREETRYSLDSVSREA